MKLIEAAGYLWESENKYLTTEIANILAAIFSLAAAGKNTLVWETDDELLNPPIYDFFNDNGFIVTYYGNNQTYIEW
jgi:hypothetical protein